MTDSFPIQGHYDPDRRVRVLPCRCSWADAERAYAAYAARYGRQQSLERLAERGGFCRREMDEFAPGWVEMPR